DAVFTAHATLENAQQYYRDVKEQAAQFGRNPDEIVILPALSPIIGKTIKKAKEKYEELAHLVSIDRALSYLGRYFDHHDFTQYPLDDPFPELGEIGENSFRSTTDRIKQDAKEQKLTLRQVAIREATPRTEFIGTPEVIADLIEKWFEERGADGFIIAESLPGTLNDFVDKVVPILQKRGIYRNDYNAETLRGHLGLPFKE